MFRLIQTLLLAAVITGGLWLLLHHDQIQHPGQLVTMVRDKLAAVPVGFQSKSLPVKPSVASTPVIRIASFKLNGSTQDTLGMPAGDFDQLPILTEICRRYDVIALQGVQGRDDSWLQMLTQSLNARERSSNYYFIADGGGAKGEPTQNAILFNRHTVELDQLNWYTVHDPDHLLRRTPLVGWFSTRIPNREEAFTFTLVNIELAPVRPDLELAYLGELFRAIRNDGRGEDDIIIAGDFNAGDRGLEPIQKRAGLMWAISNTPTDIRNTGQFDNLVFSQTATTEFTGQSGIFDFLRKFNLRLSEAETLSRRKPVWAEFSVFEGGRRELRVESPVSRIR